MLVHFARCDPKPSDRRWSPGKKIYSAERWRSIDERARPTGIVRLSERDSAVVSEWIREDPSRKSLENSDCERAKQRRESVLIVSARSLSHHFQNRIDQDESSRSSNAWNEIRRRWGTGERELYQHYNVEWEARSEDRKHHRVEHRRVIAERVRVDWGRRDRANLILTNERSNAILLSSSETITRDEWRASIPYWKMSQFESSLRVVAIFSFTGKGHLEIHRVESKLSRTLSIGIVEKAFTLKIEHFFLSSLRGLDLHILSPLNVSTWQSLGCSLARPSARNAQQCSTWGPKVTHALTIVLFRISPTWVRMYRRFAKGTWT